MTDTLVGLGRYEEALITLIFFFISLHGGCGRAGIEYLLAMVGKCTDPLTSMQRTG